MAAPSAAAEDWNASPVDLNRPGALEMLKRERPRHFEAASEVLKVAERLPCQDGEFRVLQARFELKDLACTLVVLTSDPPKRRIHFELEGTKYVALVTLKDARGTLRPAVETR